MLVNVSRRKERQLDEPRRRRRKFGLRARVTIFFMLTGLVVSAALSGITYVVARNYLVDQRHDTVRTQAFRNAVLVQSRLRDLTERGSPPAQALDSITPETDGFALLVVSGTADSPGFSRPTRQGLQQAFPDTLIDSVRQNGTSGTQLFRLDAPSGQFSSLDGDPYIAVGVDMPNVLPDVSAQYYEAFPLASVERTLRVIGTSLGIGAFVTTLAAAGLGLWTSRRLMRPLSRVSAAASELAAGSLDVRITPEHDPDLSRLATSFNRMADAVQARIQREARFASDVSHELRSPITALSAAVDVLDARREEFPGRSRQALDVVVTQVRRFDQMVLDLLELSRIDAGATELNREELLLDDTVRRIAQRYGYGSIPIVVDPKVKGPVYADKRRLERIVGNLLDNAQHHAGGPVKIAIEDGGPKEVHLVVEDAGPGVSASEKQRIFERFARRTAARHRVGTGLGLALVAEHAAAHGGQAWVEDRMGGGSRFVVSLPKGSAR
jgi:signal transduction histidine kinase